MVLYNMTYVKANFKSRLFSKNDIIELSVTLGTDTLTIDVNGKDVKFLSDLLKWETNRPVFTWFSTVLRRNPALTTSYTVTTNRYNVADDVEGKVRGMVDAICAAAVAIARIDLSAPAEQQGRYNGGRRQRNPRKAPAPASTAKRWLPTERKVAHRGALRRRGPRRQASRQGRRRVEEGALRTRLTTFSLGTRPGRIRN